MKNVLKILFEQFLRKNENIKKIETIEDLCEAVWDSKNIARIFAATNDDGNFSTAEILSIADEVYQEVCAQ